MKAALLDAPAANGKRVTITPNGAGSTAYIDARGADAAGMARLHAPVLSINGSIEQRALSAYAEMKRREPIRALA